MRRTKIVCTIGPASSSTAELDRLAAAGLDVARLNFSHGTHDEHAEVIRRIREGEARWGRPVAILQDLQGPKIRLGTFGPGGGARVDLEPGGTFALSMRSVVGTAERASITHPEFLKDLRPGDQVWMDDGMIQLLVEAVLADEVRCRVVVGGRISDHKGLSLPHASLPMSCLTDKDREDLKFGLRQRVDFVAVSFVRSADDIEEVRRFLRAEGADDVPLVAKLERHEVLASLPGVLNVVDAVMVARGDLGVDVPLEDVPHIQKEIIRQARGAKVPVIVATQMLESMIHQPHPTRAEVSDVANATLDGADALMLSAETSVGEYPAEAVATMSRVIEAAESEGLVDLPPINAHPGTRSAAIAAAAARVAQDVGAKALVAFTQSGTTVARLASHRSPIPLLAFTTDPAIRSQLSLTWGVETFIVPTVHHTDDMVHAVDSALVSLNRCAIGDKIVIVAGSPPGSPGKTNALRVHRIGDAVALPYP